MFDVARPATLPAINYRGVRIYAVTCCAYRRRRVLTVPGVARTLISLLEQYADTCGFDLLVYCVMPDHVHIVARGTTATSDFKAFMGAWRQQSAFVFAQQSHARLWQRGLFDRVVRLHDDLDRLASYVLDNPVRAGLVPSASSWPWSGGQWRARL